MKSTEHFKQAIDNHLKVMAREDPLFAYNLQNENKNIDDCITYILNTVKKSECNGFTDDEIFGMAAHYYDEDDIEVGKGISCGVVVNYHVELTEEEKVDIKKKAMSQALATEHARITKKPVVKSVVVKQVELQGSLF